MHNTDIERRRILRFGMTAAGAAALSTVGGSPLTPTTHAQADGQAGMTDFRVDIPGLPLASRHLRELRLDGLTVQPSEPTPASGDVARLRPGGINAAYGYITCDIPIGAGSRELETWYDEASSGKNIRKNITVTLFKSDKTPGRSYTLFDCFPTQWSAVNFDTSSTVQTETLKVKIGRIEFKV